MLLQDYLPTLPMLSSPYLPFYHSTILPTTQSTTNMIKSNIGIFEISKIIISRTPACMFVIKDTMYLYIYVV